MKKSVLGNLVLCSILSADCIRDNKNETVSCDDSNLMWQDNVKVKKSHKNWGKAIEYCENLDFASYTDWRLPNVNELVSINDDTRANPSLNKAFANFWDDYYWSSTSVFNNEHSAWRVLINGGINNIGKHLSYSVRCVRDIQ